jgi:hypothetical protein
MIQLYHLLESPSDGRERKSEEKTPLAGKKKGENHARLLASDPCFWLRGCARCCSWNG